MTYDFILHSDALSALKTIPDNSIHACMTSPPYFGLRDYGVAGQLGLEKTPEEYITKLCDIFSEVQRVLKPEGTCWINLGDTYSSQRWSGNGADQPINKMKDGHRDINRKRETGLPPKCLIQIPSRFAVEMTNRGWILRNEIIWHKGSCMPSSVKDRFTVDFEKIFFFTKSTKYYFKQQTEPLAQWTTQRLRQGKWCSRIDSKINRGVLPMSAESFNKAIDRMKDRGYRNKRSVWKINPRTFKEAHFATYPEELCETPLDAGCPVGGIVLDPFFGAGTTGVVALKQGKHYIGIEINKEYISIAERRLSNIKTISKHGIDQQSHKFFTFWQN